MDKTALLKKIRALAEHGVGGEAENAEKLLARMMKKYGISEAELDEETRVRHDFTYHGGEEKKILKQVVYKVTGGYTYELVYTASGRKVRTQLGADCTPAEKVEIEYLFDFYKRLWEKEKDAFLAAYIQKHRKVEEIDDVLAQMDEADARILRLWYIERKSKEEIAEAVCYASPTSIYDQRNKALVRFALLYFGAGAMPSM